VSDKRDVRYLEGFEVVGREYLPLNNGEVNLNLIEPASVDGGGSYSNQFGGDATKSGGQRLTFAAGHPDCDWGTPCSGSGKVR
jgi:hypothetical protein